ncbi:MULTISPECIES: GH3 auxin-responsive promoter family protein [unclassified Acinetobacter]|uniref:GH3 family domain-containing protein n=1 Tax=unclassified Acinetobacter TaxID=196816 RepID=UPI00244C1C0D|nr:MULTISPECIES: GH3 auxin-responsive promoter family protein [unclassified Acinetobacter]MDH0030341.1 GH3 auxin-responsive promoter family protein [Acinetobacter sp. GD04021]MDH0885909.1 GH3 auxin-responsive promoter family protein [Acinetobacter sp. GD03873]MDH1082529.1 GH3 auxin-responsive promoter family protein [Acinetobacter sp. GD03983]MDH2189079.1 GH3 auxin-responsive promoter family protein [Acinetobacter sp. GD03645]MDH2202267.1 GH3 auxin-responsive promoter family protein [Acinetoba
MKYKSWLTSGSHLILKHWCENADQKFRNGFNHQLEQVQRQVLDSILQSSTLANDKKVKNYEQFITAFSPSRYGTWREQIQQYRQQKLALSSSRLVRFQPTSGSSEQIKFIPYTQLFLDELDHAIAPWLASLYRKCPQLQQGTHYWSVSWLPESQREVLKDKNLNDDSALLGIGKRILSKFTQAVPSNVAFAANADDALFATICYLVENHNLAMISVWSPTFALQLLERLESMRDEVVEVLASGSWGNRQTSLKEVKTPYSPQSAERLTASYAGNSIDFKILWPKLSLVSSWDTAGSKDWARKLKERLPWVQFEGKGLWATEGVVTIPYDDHYPLAYQSHFYEFEYLQGDQQGQIIPSWQLKQGDVVSPIISSGNGLLRYCLDDCLRVTGFMGQIPCFEFQGRRFGVDLVGEKLAPETAQQLLSHLNQADSKAVSLLAVDTQQQAKPFYCVLFEGEIHHGVDHTYIDNLLRENFHYELARNLGQLDQPQIRQADNGWDAYKKLVMFDGIIEGNIKPEPLKKITLNSLEQL